MSFVSNKSNQLNFNDSVFNLTDREKRFLEKSWAKPFAEKIFPNINEKPFSVLYSDNASRPNTPVNVIIGSMILKEMLGDTDDELVESLMFDIRYQYALHTTSFEEQPLSDRTLSRFRERCITYETETGIDLIKSCINSLSSQIAEFMGIRKGLNRMDSMMVASNIKKLSRLELLYTCVSNLVNLMKRKEDDIPEELKHYCDADDQNKVIYHMRSENIDDKIKIVLKDASLLLHKCKGSYDESSEYQLLIRVIKEQTTTAADGNLELKSKNDETLDASILQNPSDPDATFRFKSGKEHRGYVANLIETVDENKSIITDYSYEQNIHSDSAFLKESIDGIAGTEEHKVTLVTDGAYGGLENIELSKEKHINLVTTNMQGRKATDIYAEFTFSEDGKKVLKCAGGQTPLTNKFNPQTEQCRITLDKNKCNQCPYKDQCNPKFNKKKASLIISWKSAERAKQQRYMKSENFKELARFRNGVESLPSILRRKYRVDKMPVRGKLRTKLHFGIKVAALNFQKLFNFTNSSVSCTLEPELC
ncbi:MAG: transposase [Candidatus Margulisbacteria bacterium]|nr:transposase [Candidatus Margulisiibacteriota bacterium]